MNKDNPFAIPEPTQPVQGTPPEGATKAEPEVNQPAGDGGAAPEGVKPEAAPTPEEQAATTMFTADELTQYGQEFSTTGDISAESEQAILDRLKPVFGDAAKSLFDGYKAGLQADKVVEQATKASEVASLQQAAGDQESWSAVVEWGSSNLSDTEKAVHNKIMESGSVEEKQAAIRNLRARYESSLPYRPPNRRVTGGRAADAVKPYPSRRAMYNAINDPRYDPESTKFDPEYRNLVIKRSQLTN